MKNFWVICRKELAAYFYSPIAYVVTTIFLVAAGYFFVNLVFAYADVSQKVLSNPNDPYVAQYLAQFPLNTTEMIFRPLFSNLSVIMLLILPLLTMRLLAEEKKAGTFELLLTYPLRDLETVLGKFAACWLVFAVMLGLTLLYPLLLAMLDTAGTGAGLEFGPLCSNYLGLLLLGGAFIAIGLLASSLTSNQIIAAVVAFGALLVFWLIGFSAETVGPGLGAILRHISLLEHFENFSKGILASQDVIYYLNVVVLGLFLTLRALESHKWRG